MFDINYGKWEDFESLLLNKRIVEWNEDILTLDDGTQVTIEMSESDCCADAGGTFEDVKLDALITNVSEPDIKENESSWGVKNKAVVTIFHNNNPVAKANFYAEHNGYYYCIASFVVKDVHYKVVSA